MDKNEARADLQKSTHFCKSTLILTMGNICKTVTQAVSIWVYWFFCQMGIENPDCAFGGTVGIL